MGGYGLNSSPAPAALLCAHHLKVLWYEGDPGRKRSTLCRTEEAHRPDRLSQSALYVELKPPCCFQTSFCLSSCPAVTVYSSQAFWGADVMSAQALPWLLLV